MNIDNIQTYINKLEKYYDSSCKPSPEELVQLKQQKLPNSYLKFIEKFGFGVILSDILYIWSKPENTNLVYSNNINLKNLTTFGENTSGEMLAFNLNNTDDSVYEINSSGTIIKEYKSFYAFITEYLEYIIEIENL